MRKVYLYLNCLFKNYVKPATNLRKLKKINYKPNLVDFKSYYWNRGESKHLPNTVSTKNRHIQAHFFYNCSGNTQ